MILKTALPLLVAGVLLASCGDSEESLTSSLTPSYGDQGTLTYAQIRPILTSKCVLCHAEYAQESKVVESAQEIHDVVEDFSMPASGVSRLSPQDRIDLLAWATQAAGLSSPNKTIQEQLP